MTKSTTVSVKILDKEYQVACAEEEVEALTASARLLDRHMEEIRGSGKVFGLDRIAVMAALNIANDYLHTKIQSDDTREFLDQRVVDLTARIDKAITEQQNG